MGATDPSNVVPLSAAKTTPGKVRALQAQTTSTPVTTIETPSGGGGDGHGDWRQSVETRLGDLRSDVRNLLYGGAFVAVGLIIAGWGTYTAAMNQLRDLAVSQKEISGKIETLDAKLSGRLDLMEQRLGDKSQTSP